MAPDPTEKYFESSKENKLPVNPQRQWVSEAGPNSQNLNNIINNWPSQQHGTSSRTNRPPFVRTRSYENEATTSHNPNGRDTYRSNENVATTSQNPDVRNTDHTKIV